MSMRINDDNGGNSEKDWEIFDVLCRNMDKVCLKLRLLNVYNLLTRLTLQTNDMKLHEHDTKFIK